MEHAGVKSCGRGRWVAARWVPSSFVSFRDKVRVELLEDWLSPA